METGLIAQFMSAANRVFADQFEVILVALLTAGFFLFSRHILKREIYRGKTLASIITSYAFAVMNSLLAPAAYFAHGHVEAAYLSLNIPTVPADFWGELPFVALCLISLVAYDFVEYWNHRWLHSKWLWPIHAIHHSDPDVNGFTTYRVHFLQILFNMVSFTLFLTWLGMPKEVAAATGLIVTLVNAYVHLDVDWGHGPFRLWLASPRFHRWHHADTPELYGKNIANMFPIWDVLFGTYHVPGVCREPMGAVGVPENSILRLVAYPFTEWARMIAYAVKTKSPKRGEEKAPIVPAE